MSSLIESLIDFSDEDIPKELSTVFLEKLNRTQNKIKDSVNSAKLSTFIKDGFTVAIIGKPNVGKSSLINALTKLNTSILRLLIIFLLNFYKDLSGLPDDP